MIYRHYSEYPMDKWRWPSFSPREMASKREGEIGIDPDSMDKLQTLRNRLARPLVITSAYRSRAHNTAVGGAKNSMHLQGRAFDVRMDNHDPEAFEIAARAVGFNGIGHYPKQGFMHIDTGPVRRWNSGGWFKKSATGLASDAHVKETEKSEHDGSVVLMPNVIDGRKPATTDGGFWATLAMMLAGIFRGR